MVKANKRKSCFTATRLSLSVAVALAAIGSASSWAFTIDTANPDIKARWDNTVRYNTGWRMEDIKPEFANAYGSDETESRFKKHDMVINRLDLFTEFDFIYKTNYGFRVSAAGWSENAYKDTSQTGSLIDSTFTGPMSVPSNYGTSKKYSKYAKRYVTGSSGEIFDAFVFSNFILGDTSLNLKLGQHNIYWGEAMFTIADGVSAGQGPIDTIKASTSPGAEVKELFMPLQQFSAQWSLTDEVALNAQYLLDWKPYRIMPGGTYFSSGDGAGNPPCASTAPGGTCIVSLNDVTPGRNGGDYGVNLRWSPAALAGTVGFYYRKYDERLPWSVIQLQGFNPTNPANMGLRLSYARDTEMFGLSLQRNLGPVSSALEVSYRHNTALNSVAGFFAGSSNGAAPASLAYFGSAAANIALNQTPGYLQVEGARGDTYHIVANGQYLLTKTPLWDNGVIAGEISYQRLDKVTKNASLYYSKDYACRFGYLPGGIVGGTLDRTDGCATRDAIGINLYFNPAWTQVLPGVDLAMPTSLAYGLKGNAPTIGGFTQGSYNWSIGLTATYRIVYEFGIAYNDSHVDYKTVMGTGATGVPGVPVFSTASGSGAVQNNHGWLSFHFKTNF